MKITNADHLDQLITAAGLDQEAVAMIIDEALLEDLGGRGVWADGPGVDVTTEATVAEDARATARLVARAPGTVAGVLIAAAVFARVSGPQGPIVIELISRDGEEVVRDDVIMVVTGPTRALLRAERVALNLITLMSGVATATSRWVTALGDTSTRVRDTRKTVPGLRMLQKYAVAVAGGTNHRRCLADAALIKDNHVIAAGGVVEAFLAVRTRFPTTPIQVEVTRTDQVGALITAGATEILLDNMTVELMREVITTYSGRAVFEASGGLSLDRALEVASTGVDFVAVGAITHSAPILDLALDLDLSTAADSVAEVAD